MAGGSAEPLPLPERSRLSALIPAAGSGNRVGGTPKAMLRLDGSTLAERVTAMFRPFAVRVVVGVRAEEFDQVSGLLSEHDDVEVVVGGASRQETVRRLLDASDTELVLIHDVARPFTPVGVIERVLAEAAAHGAAAPCLQVPVRDSLALRQDGTLGQPLRREDVVAIQTPYAMRRDWMIEADDRARAEGWNETSTMTLLTKAGFSVRVVDGHPDNYKVTYVDDLARAGIENPG